MTGRVAGDAHLKECGDAEVNRVFAHSLAMNTGLSRRRPWVRVPSTPPIPSSLALVGVTVSQATRSRGWLGRLLAHYLHFMRKGGGAGDVAALRRGTGHSWRSASIGALDDAARAAAEDESSRKSTTLRPAASCASVSVTTRTCSIRCCPGHPPPPLPRRPRSA